MSVADVSVVIPTIGRPELLEQAMKSLEACEPRPAEVVVVDQSDQLISAPIVERSALPRARTIASSGRGVAVALNEGLKNAGYPIVLITADDCTVRADWVGVADHVMREEPQGIISGQVLPGAGDPRAVPSTIVLDEPRDYTGQVRHDVLFGNNMVCPREAVLELGGFDTRVAPSGEDCDLCYRWLADSRPLRHVPELVVWHHDWRSPDDLNRLYVDYARGLGVLYAKHLLAGDLRVLRFLRGDLRGAVRGLYDGLIHGAPRWTDYRRGVFTGMPSGLWTGWRRFGPLGRSRRPTVAAP